MDYNSIMDIQYKIVSKEKDLFTDRLLNMGKIMRTIDNEKRIIKQGIYAIGTQKDLRIYNKHTNDSHLRELNELKKYESDILEPTETTIGYDNEIFNNNVFTEEQSMDDMIENEALALENEEYDLFGNDEDMNDNNLDDE
jgi:hypothetical protein